MTDLRKRGAAKPIVMIVLLVLLLVAGVVLIKEAGAQGKAHSIADILNLELNNGPTDEEVHEKLGMTPTTTRNPTPRKYVEEYSNKGLLRTYTVYAYYRTGAANFLEAVSVNEKIPKWESE